MFSRYAQQHGCSYRNAQCILKEGDCGKRVLSAAISSGPPSGSIAHVYAPRVLDVSSVAMEMHNLFVKEVLSTEKILLNETPMVR